MTDVTPSNAPIQIEGLEFRGAASEATVQAMGGAINGSLEALDPVGAEASPVTPANLIDVSTLNDKISQNAGISTTGGVPTWTAGTTPLSTNSKLVEVLAAVVAKDSVDRAYDVNHSFSSLGFSSASIGVNSVPSFSKVSLRSVGTNYEIVQFGANPGDAFVSFPLPGPIPVNVTEQTRWGVLDFSTNGSEWFVRIQILRAFKAAPY